MKKYRIILTLIALVLVITFFPYLKAEFLTYRYGSEFAGLETQTNMLHSSYYKVLNYSERKADVFYVSVSDTGDLITFIKDENGDWIIETWKTIWSTSGSADGFIWPYYR